MFNSGCANRSGQSGILAKALLDTKLEASDSNQSFESVYETAFASVCKFMEQKAKLGNVGETAECAPNKTVD